MKRKPRSHKEEKRGNKAEELEEDEERWPLNIKKTNCILLRSNKNHLNDPPASLSTNGQDIERVYSTELKFQMPYWSPNKLSKYFGLFFKSRHLPPLSALLTIYKILFDPHLNYCNVIWCNTFPSHLKKNYRLFRKIVVCVLLWSELKAVTGPLFCRLGPLRLSEHDVFHNACMLFQVVHRLNYWLWDLVPICHLQHTCDTRVNISLLAKTKARAHKLECCVQATTDLEWAWWQLKIDTFCLHL